MRRPKHGAGVALESAPTSRHAKANAATRGGVSSRRSTTGARVSGQPGVDHDSALGEGAHAQGAEIRNQPRFGEGRPGHSPHDALTRSRQGSCSTPVASPGPAAHAHPASEPALPTQTRGAPLGTEVVDRVVAAATTLHATSHWSGLPPRWSQPSQTQPLQKGGGLLSGPLGPDERPLRHLATRSLALAT